MEYVKQLLKYDLDCHLEDIAKLERDMNEPLVKKEDIEFFKSEIQKLKFHVKSINKAQSFLK